MISFDEYQKQAMRTDGTTLSEERLMNAVLGLNGEAGEIADYLKKYLFHGHESNMDHVIKELGDILWYVAQACTALDKSMEDVARMNIEKLRKRYPSGFSSEASINRTE